MKVTKPVPGAHSSRARAPRVAAPRLTPMASPTLSCYIVWFPCSSVSESVSISHRHCPEAVKTTQHVRIPSLESLSKRILCKSGLARVSVPKESTKLGESAANARFCARSLRNMSPARPRQSPVFSAPGRRKGLFFPALLKQHGVTSSMGPWTFLCATRPTERLPSLRSRALLRPAREARFSENPRRNLCAVERCPPAPCRTSRESSDSRWPSSVGG